MKRHRASSRLAQSESSLPVHRDAAPHYLGLDIGTGACKAVAFDEQGRVCASARREYAVRFTPDEGAELDADEVMAACFAAIRETADALPPASIRSLGVSSQGEAFTPVDREGRALHPAMVSSDMRAEALAREWPQSFGAERLYQVTGHTAHPMFTLFKLLWLQQARPDVWTRTSQFLCFEDLLHRRLGIDPAIGWPLAGRTMFFDVRKHTWDDGILRAAGVAPAQLARPLPSGAVAGAVPADVAAQLGLAPGALVVCGGHDQPCGALGAGVTEPGLAMYATGSVECITPAFAAPIFDEALRANNLCTYDHALAGLYTTVAFSLTGGNLLTWFRNEFGGTECERAGRTGADAYSLLLDLAGTEPSPLLALPYFTPSGTPYFDTRTKGAILGLRLSTTRGQVLRSLLEGVAFEMRLNLEILESAGGAIRELRVIGGGAKSDAWTQLKADVLGRPVVSLDVAEAGCLGTAVLACAACTRRPPAVLVRDWVRPRRAFAPDPARAAWYRKRFDLYRRLRPALSDLAI